MNEKFPPSSLLASRGLAGLGVVALLLYAGVLGLLYWKQEALLFAPVRLPEDHAFAIAGIVERRIVVPGAVLSALHFRQPDAKGVVFFLHGNAGSLQQWLTSTDFYRRTRFDLFMIDYRGYGKSSGRIESEAQLHADVRAAWNAIAPEYAGRKRVVYGRSLGTGLATYLAREAQADLLVLVSPYSSLRDVAREHYPWVPGALLRYPMRTDLWLPQVAMPVLILHGEADTVIGLEHAQRLAALSPGCLLVRLPGVGHNDVHRSREYLETLAARLAEL